MMRPAGKFRFDWISKRRQRRIECRQLYFTLLPSLEGETDRREQAAQAGISGERAEERLCCNQLVGDILDLLDRKEQQAVASEKFTPIGAPYGLIELRTIAQPLRQGRGGVLGLSRSCGIDDNGEEIDVLREGAIEFGLALAP